MLGRFLEVIGTKWRLVWNIVTSRFPDLDEIKKELYLLPSTCTLNPDKDKFRTEIFKDFQTFNWALLFLKMSPLEHPKVHFYGNFHTIFRKKLSIKIVSKRGSQLSKAFYILLSVFEKQLRMVWYELLQDAQHQIRILDVRSIKWSHIYCNIRVIIHFRHIWTESEMLEKTPLFVTFVSPPPKF